MLKHRRYRKQMRILGEELERASSAFDQVAYNEVLKKIRKVHSKLYRSYGRFYRDLGWWVILVLAFVFGYVVYLILR